MSQQNVEVVRRIYELAVENWAGGRAARLARDANPIFELWDPELVIEENQAFPDRAAYHGYDGLVRWWTSFFEIYDEVRIEPREFLPAGDQVVVPARHLLASKSGVKLERDVTHVWRLRDGRVVHVTGYFDRSEALEAVGLGE